MRLTTSILTVGLLLSLGCTGLQRPAGTPSEGERAPKYGGALNLRLEADISNLDPAQAQSSESRFVGERAYNGLLAFKSGPDIKYEAAAVLKPQLAERWEASPDARTYTFQLRRGVKFADLPPVNGRELTSSDVKFSLEYSGMIGPFKDAKFLVPTNAVKLEGLDRVETPDPYTVVLHFKEGFAPFLSYAATPELAILPREIYEQDGHFKNRAVGTGPWQLDPASGQVGTRMVWKKNPSYWDTGKPFIDEVRDIILPDQAAVTAAFLAKQLDVLADRSSRPELDSIRTANPTATVQEWLQDAPFRIFWNVNRPPMNDVRLRKAISLGLDRDEFIRTLTGGKGQWAAAGTDPKTFTQEELRQMLRHDPQEARRLLSEAGYPPGFVLETVWSPDYGDLQEVELLQAQMKRIGLDVVIKPGAKADVSSIRKSGNYTLTTLDGGQLPAPDIDIVLFGSFHPKSATNHYKVNDPALTALLEATRQHGDAAKRSEAVRSAARYINDHAIGAWVYYGIGFNYWQSRVQGYAPNWAIKAKPVPEMWLDK